ncbi:MAG: NADP-dependent malic enzyme [Firmicutes bacterium]|nr:NADP-dependent malic enzyme [Bacillota bacterium]
MQKNLSTDKLSKDAIKAHKKWKGKYSIELVPEINNYYDLSLAYTPGVAAACKEIEAAPQKVFEYTRKGNLVAVITDGTAVLGLGDIGVLGSLPVMEGKVALFKKFGGLDAIPILVDTKDTEQFIATVKNIAQSFGGINLEDIASPRCFQILKRLQSELDIPVFHDDQHGTAIVTLGALFNALKLVGKQLEDINIVINGPGAAGVAIAELLLSAGAKNIIMCDEFGILHKGRLSALGAEKLDDLKSYLTNITNLQGKVGNLTDALKGADVFIGVSVGGIVSGDMIKQMAKQPIVFALANPIPEILPVEAEKGGAYIVGTGRSDFKNQINNALVFPPLFRGVLNAQQKTSANIPICTDVMLAAALALSKSVADTELTREFIVPSLFNQSALDYVAGVVEKVALDRYEASVREVALVKQ